MSKQFVVETLICENCLHCCDVGTHRKNYGICSVAKEFVLLAKPFCNQFDGLPLLEVKSTPKQLVANGYAYFVC